MECLLEFTIGGPLRVANPKNRGRRPVVTGIHQLIRSTNDDRTVDAVSLTLFSAGGTIAAFLFPVHLFLSAWPFPWDGWRRRVTRLSGSSSSIP